MNALYDNDLDLRYHAVIGLAEIAKPLTETRSAPASRPLLEMNRGKEGRRLSILVIYLDNILAVTLFSLIV
jgi:hypothetical protein